MAAMRTSNLAVCVLWLVVQSCSALKEDDGSGGLRNAVLQATEAIRKGMIEPVKYSEPNLKLDYQASTQYNPRGMANLYKVTNFFMDVIQKRDPYPEGFFSVSSDGRFQMADPRKEWHTLLMHYPGVVAVLAIGLLFAVLMPCVGFVFCCCRCSGRCGARSQPFEKRRDPCKRIGFGVLLSCITIIILYGVVCAFVTNEYMEEGTQKLPSKVRTSLNDTKLYMSNTQLEIKNLLEINFEELKQELDNVLHRSGEIVQQELFKASNATVLSNLTALVRGLSAIRKDLEEIDNNTKGLKEKSNILKERLRQVQNELLEQMKKCNSSCLDSLKDNIHNMTTNTDFNELPVIEDSLQTVSGLLTGGIEDKVEAGLRNFNKIKENIQKAVSDLLPSISANMDKVGNATSEQAKKINHILSNVSQAVTKHSSKYIDHGERALREYGHYRYYVGLGVSSILLVILLCATLGLFYGFCGKRPDGYGDDCCTKATGAWFLILGVWVIFLLSAVLMAITLAHFLVGIVAKRAVCEPLQKPDDNQLLALLDEAVKANRILDFLGDQKVDISLTSIIRSCHANGSIYEVLQVGKLVNISEVSNYKTRFKIEKDINALKNKINFNGSVTILSRDARIDLTRLLTSNITRIDFSSFTKILNKSIVSIDLMSLVEKLRTTASRIASVTPDIRDSLEKQARVLESLQNNEVRYMERMVKNLENKTKSLELNLKFNHSSLNETIILLLDEVDTAQNYLNYNASREIRHLADEFADAILQHVDQYLNRVVSETRTRVGQCHPLSQVYNATIIAACNEILDPFNGFWASIGWCLALFIPVIVLSVKLAALYEKSDPYPGPLVESEYLYDAYGDRDNIPLANVDKKNYHRRYHESYENASGYYGGDYNAHLGRSGERGSSRGERASPGAHSDTRYTDMAPKHWDYPNGGPPRYHSPPLSTEYERPPPYYYPGPGDTSRR